MNNVCDVRNPTEETEQLDDWTEDDTEIPAGVTDTMLTATDFLEDSERAQQNTVSLIQFATNGIAVYILQESSMNVYCNRNLSDHT